ncbi:MAG TPA: DegT/DnrJ/EryC1/StrS aminotransferase family protein, partial [Candidatus Bathyarchaeia archaeon]|nr:DegT/DnrJ/EryC1/StrS aminotransferase family protein [Candidatus Bathyarchaeia archaeon]
AMIPRYDPTYSSGDIVESLRLGAGGTAESDLCRRLRDLYRVKHVFAFDSGRSALFAALKAHGRPGGVLMPAYTCIVVPEAVRSAGYRPVFADIDLRTLQASGQDLARAAAGDTTVVLATHLFGAPCDIEGIERLGRDRGLLVIEDAAPALGLSWRGRPVRGYGHATVVSFDATKAISGEKGGALLTDDDALAAKVGRLLEEGTRARGRWRLFVRAAARKAGTRRPVYPLVLAAYRRLGKEVMVEVAASGRDDPRDFLRRASGFSCALALLQLDRLPENLARRRRIAAIYTRELEGHPALTVPAVDPQSEAAWIQFPVMAEDKRGFYRYMQARGVDLSWTYRYSCPVTYGLEGFPNARRAAETVLGLPTYPSLAEDEARRISEIARAYLPA